MEQILQGMGNKPQDGRPKFRIEEYGVYYKTEIYIANLLKKERKERRRKH